MPLKVGEVEALYRYPVKSMMGEHLDAADLGWHGIEGDRRLALRRMNDRGGFPWLTASKLPELILYAPVRQGPSSNGDLPTHVRTPEGRELVAFGPELVEEIGHRRGEPIEMMYLDRGIFDEASVSVITSGTLTEVGRLAAQPPDARRFRPNIVIKSSGSTPFVEEGWVGGTLWFGAAADCATVSVTNWDVRCSMVNLDPDTARPAPEVLRTVVRERGNKAGVYGTVVRRGRIEVGQVVFFEPSAQGTRQ